jgi:hypothetical protein
MARAFGRALLEALSANVDKAREEEKAVEEKNDEYKKLLRTMALEQHKTAMQNYTTKREMYERVKRAPTFITYAQMMGIDPKDMDKYDMTDMQKHWDKEVKPNVGKWVETFKPTEPRLEDYLGAADEGALASGYKFDDGFTDRVGRVFGVPLKYREPEIRKGLAALSAAERKSRQEGSEDGRAVDRLGFTFLGDVPVKRAKEEENGNVFYFMGRDGKLVSSVIGTRAAKVFHNENPELVVTDKLPDSEKENTSDPVSYIIQTQDPTTRAWTVVGTTQNKNEARNLARAAEQQGANVVVTPATPTGMASLLRNTEQNNRMATAIISKMQYMYNSSTGDVKFVLPGSESHKELLSNAYVPIQPGQFTMMSMQNRRLEQNQEQFDRNLEQKTRMLEADGLFRGTFNSSEAKNRAREYLGIFGERLGVEETEFDRVPDAVLSKATAKYEAAKAEEANNPANQEARRKALSATTQLHSVRLYYTVFNSLKDETPTEDNIKKARTALLEARTREINAGLEEASKNASIYFDLRGKLYIGGFDNVPEDAFSIDNKEAVKVMRDNMARDAARERQDIKFVQDRISMEKRVFTTNMANPDRRDAFIEEVKQTASAVMETRLGDSYENIEWDKAYGRLLMGHIESLVPMYIGLGMSRQQATYAAVTELLSPDKKYVRVTDTTSNRLFRDDPNYTLDERKIDELQLDLQRRQQPELSTDNTPASLGSNTPTGVSNDPLTALGHILDTYQPERQEGGTN